jgi:hypothetical protein
VSYSYSASSTDPNGDSIKYGWDWNGDGVVDEWTNFFASGSPVTFSHSWSTPGTYNAKVKAQDFRGAESNWSQPLTVNISSPANSKDDLLREKLKANRDRLLTRLKDVPGGQWYGKANACEVWKSMDTSQRYVFLTHTDLLGQRSLLYNYPMIFHLITPCECEDAFTFACAPPQCTESGGCTFRDQSGNCQTSDGWSCYYAGKCTLESGSPTDHTMALDHVNRILWVAGSCPWPTKWLEGGVCVDSNGRSVGNQTCGGEDNNRIYYEADPTLMGEFRNFYAGLPMWDKSDDPGGPHKGFRNTSETLHGRRHDFMATGQTHFFSLDGDPNNWVEGRTLWSRFCNERNMGAACNGSIYGTEWAGRMIEQDLDYTYPWHESSPVCNYGMGIGFQQYNSVWTNQVTGNDAALGYDPCASINNPPVAQNQSVVTAQDTAKAITLMATDADGNPLTYRIVTYPGHGSLSGTPPNVTYTPASNYFGSDSFTFKANDPKVDSNLATVSITVNASGPGLVNYALASQGGVASGSSYVTPGKDFSARGANNGDPKGLNWEQGGGWNSARNPTIADPQELTIIFNGMKSISAVNVFTIQDNYLIPATPALDMQFSNFGIQDFEVYLQDGNGSWVLIPEGYVTANNRVWRQFKFSARQARAAKVKVTRALAGFARIVEVEALGTDSVPQPAVNYALSSQGGVALGDAYNNDFPTRAANDGDRSGAKWGNEGGWNSTGNPETQAQVLTIRFDGPKSISEVDVFTLRDDYGNPENPTFTTEFTQYGIVDFEVQLDGGSNNWVTIPGGKVPGNNRVWRQFTFSPMQATAVRAVITKAKFFFARIVELEAWGVSSSTGVTSSATRADFSGDGATDILWQNQATGEVAVWYMNESNLVSAQGISSLGDTRWKIVGTGDFHGDRKTDILWRHSSTGENLVWLMNGGSYSSSSWLPEVADTNWEIVGTGDFNGDRKTDILWRHKTSGDNAVWLMDGVTYSSFALLPQIADTNWEIVGTGDFNGDRKTDILWHHQITGQVALWLMDGLNFGSLQGISTVGDFNWKIAGSR